MNLMRAAFRASQPSLSRVQSLFLPNDTAVLLDPSASALYADAAGTTPAVLGGPVGLRLDVARGTALGSELVQDPALDNPASWLIEPAWSISNGVATSPLGSAGYIYARPVPFTTGAFYLIEIDVVEIVNSLQLIGAAYSPAVSFTSAANGTTVRCIVRALQSELAIYSHSTASAVISRVSARRVFGNHASQPTTALCPILRVTPETNRRWLEAPDADDALNLTFAVAPGTMYVGRGTAEGVEWSAETWGTAVNTIRQGRFNSWMIARSRQFTANEKALVEGYYRRVLPTLGPNLVINGEFEANTDGWDPVNSAILSVVAGKLKTLANGVVNPTATQAITTVAGRAYTLSVYLEDGTVRSQARAGTTAGAFNLLNTEVSTSFGTAIGIFTASGTTTYISHKINSAGASTNFAYFDNCVVKEVV